MGVAVTEVVWIRGLLKEVNIEQIKPVVLFCDNQATHQIATNPMYHKRTKHIEVDCHFFRDHITEKDVAEHIITKDQLADILTKALGSVQHNVLLNRMGVKNIFKPEPELEMTECNSKMEAST